MISAEQIESAGWAVLGTDALGRQVFSVIDAAGTQKNWIVGDDNALIWLPDGAARNRSGSFYVTQDQATAQGWTPRGYDRSGNQLFSIVDAAGVTKNWGYLADGAIFYLPDTGAPTAGPAPAVTPPPAVVTPPPINTSGNTSTGATGANPLIPTGQNSPAISPLFDPTPRLAGYDSAGRRVFTQIDEAGTVVEWTLSTSGAAINVHNLTGGNATPSNVVSITPGTTTPPAPNGGSNKNLLLWGLLGVGAVLVYLGMKNKNRG